MLIIFDGRAQSVPLWLSASGFGLWEGVQIAGAQYRIPYAYKVGTPDLVHAHGGTPSRVIAALLLASPLPVASGRFSLEVERDGRPLCFGARTSMALLLASLPPHTRRAPVHPAGPLVDHVPYDWKWMST